MENRHYFSNNDDLKTQPIYYDYTINNKILHFKSDIGVFSKKEIDYGSHLFIQSLCHEKIHGKGLDMGCGIGVIGISLLANDSDLQMDMVDINNRSLRLCQFNIQKNGLKANVFNSDCFSNIDQTYDFIVSNPPIRQGKEFLFNFYKESKMHLKEGGSLYIVIRKKQGAESTCKKLQEIFGNYKIIVKKSGYFILKSIFNK